MALKAPGGDRLAALARRVSIDLDDDELAAVRADLQGALDAFYAPLDRVPDYLPEVSYPRTPGYRPGADEDPLNIWYARTSIPGAADGPLAGRRVAVKDNVSLAGVPMMVGASTLEGYVPEIDATVVTRLLDAGAEIVGKTHCEYFCASGGSHTNFTGATCNPHKPSHSAGGSSSGSAAAVAAGEADMAVGGDQGGSIRVPASFCGIVGMKPTHGLVPYTGIMPVEFTLDYAGPMTASTADNALMLEVMAGRDGLDPRQQQVETHAYTEALGQDLNGLRIGVLQEGFGWDEASHGVEAVVKLAADQLRAMGATVEPVSVPMHRQAMSIWVPIMVEGVTDILLHGNALGTNWRGLYQTSLLDVHAKWPLGANQFPDGLRSFAVLAEVVRDARRGHYYAKAQNLSRQLRAAYDATLAGCDALLMPTSPVLPPPLPPLNPSREEMMSPGFAPIMNTAAFDCTGHPAISVPCGLLDGLPVGMMLVGRWFDEAGLYRIADAFERNVDWRTGAGP